MRVCGEMQNVHNVRSGAMKAGPLPARCARCPSPRSGRGGKAKNQKPSPLVGEDSFAKRSRERAGCRRRTQSCECSPTTRIAAPIASRARCNAGVPPTMRIRRSSVQSSPAASSTACASTSDAATSASSTPASRSAAISTGVARGVSSDGCPAACAQHQELQQEFQVDQAALALLEVERARASLRSSSARMRRRIADHVRRAAPRHRARAPASARAPSRSPRTARRRRRRSARAPAPGAPRSRRARAGSRDSWPASTPAGPWRRPGAGARRRRTGGRRR